MTILGSKTGRVGPAALRDIPPACNRGCPGAIAADGAPRRRRSGW